ncbi:MAG: sodium:solute symporter [Clostridia bacterium]|nr:sodium:solute symporter [Clostridia bacterium]
MKIALYLILMLAFFGLMIFIGFVCRKKAVSTDGFLLGGRNVGAWLTAFAYGTSYFSAVVFVGYAGQFGYKFGVASTWIGLGNAFIGSLLAWVILGRRTRLMTRHLKTATMSDFFGKRFNSKPLKIAAAIIIFVFLIPYTASLYNGLSRLFAMAFDLPFWVCIIIMSVLTAIYVIAGGYMATAINDFIQGIIMAFGIVAVITAVILSHGGWTEIFMSLAAVNDAEVSAQAGVFTSFFGPDVISLFFVIILTSLGTWGLPQMVQKFYAIKDESAIIKGTIISTVFAVIVAGGCYFLGGFSRLYPEAAADGYDAIIPAMMQELSPVLIGLVIILVLSASMSTLSSLSMTSASTVTLDLIKPYCKNVMTEKKQVITIRAFIVVFIVISAVIAIVQYYAKTSFIAQMMGVSWGALAGAFLAPFLYGLYSKKTTKAAVWFSYIYGVGVMLLYLLYSLWLKNYFILPAIIASPLNLGAMVMLSDLIFVPVISLFTKKPDAEYVDKIFACYQRTIIVPASVALVDEEPAPETASHEFFAEEKAETSANDNTDGNNV